MRRFYCIALLVALSVAGCKKYENGPLENFTEEIIFDPLDQNGLNAQQFLANIYAEMPTGFNRIGGDLLDAATDDAMPSRFGTTIQSIIQGNLTNASHPDGAWSKYYGGIRKVNLFLSKIDIVPKPDEVKRWKAEARFLRAFFYFELLKRYGGVPLIGDRVFDSGDDIQLPRNSFAECVDYIVSECDAVKTQVFIEPVPAPDFGKASRGSAIALKARVLLYAASPLYNGGVPAAASAAQKAVMGYPEYDLNRWDLAAKAANELLTLNVYTLEGTYNNVFLNRRNNEVILSFLRGTTTDVETNNGPVGYTLNGVSNGATSPTQQLVDAFPMANGKAITDPTSGYNAANPYNSRDPRLANTILRNGSQWLNRGVQTFEGGLDKPNRGGVQTQTGYYMRKFMGNFATAAQYSGQNHNFVLFRIAEVMLNYAEALNEFSGPSTAAVSTQLINIRKRAGIAAGSDNRYGVPTGLTQEQMRTFIRNERRIEMAFEEQRYWDLRRWKTAETELNKALEGMKTTLDDLGNPLYERVVAGKITFLPKMYYYAIPFGEISNNRMLIQNHGW